MRLPAEPRLEVVYQPDLEAEVSALLLLIGWRQLADDASAGSRQTVPLDQRGDRPPKASA